MDIQPKRLADVVYDKLCEAVVDGTLAPGQRVRDGDLAEQLGVSRMPVREALQRLERQGLIEMIASRFTRVTAVTAEMPAQSLEFLGYQLGISLRLALPRMNDEERAEAAELARETGGHVTTDAQKAYETTSRLGTFLAGHSGNALFETVMADAWLQVTRNLRGTFPLVKDANEMADDFARLADLIGSGDEIGAETQMRDIFQLGAGQPGPAHAVEGLWDDVLN
ncbi:hypothetical protein GCM10010922_09960 [Microbacterium sorbitolivorans]|nr:GntR family transcriptional regulator [Microbacterium sorbitolivorans]GGF36768.1 hypothetical protein GCM10010922_09960 [Microbacterium sorbitolivorans]